MRMFLLLAFYLIINFNYESFCQQDIFIKYNALTNEIVEIDTFEIDTSIHFDNTIWNYGLLSGIETLPQENPVITFPGSGFTELVKADSIFYVDYYPLRTAAKLFGYLNDSLIQRCTGILVSKSIVLTAAHCNCYRFDSTRNFIFLDSVIVVPAFNNGTEHNRIGKSKSTTFYITKDWYNQNLQNGWKDISLLKLDDNIGDLIGWVGIGFNENDNFFEENLFYKLSYPVGGLGFDSTRLFDENYMYFNYGSIDTIINNWLGSYWLGYFIPGIPGQSGSSLLYSDNNKFITYGEQVWSLDSKHFRITQKNYYTLKHIIENITNIVFEELIRDDLDFKLEQNFPNPFNASTNIDYYLPISDNITIKLYDLLGQEIRVLYEGFQSKGYHSLQLKELNSTSGLYFYRLSYGSSSLTKKMILLR
ncbi:MAG: T9SS type A sorting domain-containing protein [Ignavibacterium sp.]|jgi:hypothetical protein|nr:T9SS type A sorting domain-containing protein [Ignavibacterium sp.]